MGDGGNGCVRYPLGTKFDVTGRKFYVAEASHALTLTGRMRGTNKTGLRTYCARSVAALQQHGSNRRGWQRHHGLEEGWDDDVVRSSSVADHWRRGASLVLLIPIGNRASLIVTGRAGRSKPHPSHRQIIMQPASRELPCPPLERPAQPRVIRDRPVLTRQGNGGPIWLYCVRIQACGGTMDAPALSMPRAVLSRWPLHMRYRT